MLSSNISKLYAFSYISVNAHTIVDRYIVVSGPSPCRRLKSLINKRKNERVIAMQAQITKLHHRMHKEQGEHSMKTRRELSVVIFIQGKNISRKLCIHENILP